MSEKKILLVEDSAEDEELTRRALRKGKILNPVDVVRDGEEAIAYLEKSELPQVVLLDLKLPKVNGFEVLQWIRSQERTRLLPVVILTSSEEKQDMMRGYSLGANSFVCKPVHPDEFIQAVQQLGVYWLLVNEGSPR